MPGSRPRLRLAILLTLGLVARLAILAPGFGTRNDPDDYLPLARSLAAGRGYISTHGRPTAYRPPLYPLVLTPLVGLAENHLAWGIAVLHVGLGLGTIGLTRLAARRSGLGPARVDLATLIVALDPVLLAQARPVMTETLAAFLVALTLTASTWPGRRGLILAGFCSGLCALARPSLLPGAILAALAVAATSRGPARGRIDRAGMFLAAFWLTITPWAIRNAVQFGRPIWTTTHGGYTLALANNPAYYADVLDGPPGAVWTGPNQAAWFDSVGPSTLGLTEPEADRALRNQAVATIRSRPRDFVRASIARLGRFWGLAPSGLVYPAPLRIASACWTAPLWGLFVLGLARRDLWRWPGILAPAMIVGLTVVHAIYWTDLRMRAPIVPAIAVVAAGAGLGRGKVGAGSAEKWIAPPG